MQPLDVPQITLQHFDNPGSNNQGSSGAAPNLLNVGPPLGNDFNSITSDDKHIGNGIGGSHHLNSFGDDKHGDNFGDHRGFKASEFGDHSFKPSHPKSFDKHHDGIVPHHTPADVQYGVPIRSIEGIKSTGFSHIAFEHFGPVKGDDLFPNTNNHLSNDIKHEIGQHEYSFSSDPHHMSGGDIHHIPDIEHIHTDAIHSIEPMKSQSLGSVPYGPPPAYGPPPSLGHHPMYGHNHKKPTYHNNLIVGDLVTYGNRPHHGKHKQKHKGGYFKNFMKMFG